MQHSTTTEEAVMGFLEKQRTIAGRYQGLHRMTARSCQWLPLVGVELKMITVKHNYVITR